jgi:hypothetical protein
LPSPSQTAIAWLHLTKETIYCFGLFAATACYLFMSISLFCLKVISRNSELCPNLEPNKTIFISVNNDWKDLEIEEIINSTSIPVTGRRGV